MTGFKIMFDSSVNCTHTYIVQYERAFCQSHIEKSLQSFPLQL